MKRLVFTAAMFAVAACASVGAHADHGDKHETPKAVDVSGAISGEYKNDKGHGYITFTYSHLDYSNPFLRWRDWDATLDWNAEDPTKSSVAVEIDVNSIDSGVDAFDDHLRASDFFDVAEHPKITFQSTEIVDNGDGMGTMTGDLTIKGITKPVTLFVTFNKAGLEQNWKKYKIGFSARGSVNRSEFDVGAYTPFVSDRVDLIIEAEFDKALEEE